MINVLLKLVICYKTQQIFYHVLVLAFAAFDVL